MRPRNSYTRIANKLTNRPLTCYDICLKTPTQFEETDKDSTAIYTDESITALEPHEAIRKRPGMYIGDLDTGQEHLVWEIVGNAIDQHLLRRATQLRVDVDVAGRRFEVEDDGPGLPVGRTRRGRSAVEEIFTTLHCGATWDGHFPHVHVAVGSYGVGAVVVGALSSRTEVEVHQEGSLWRLVLERGLIVEPLRSVGKTSRTGTLVRWTPDDEIFKGKRARPGEIARRLQELAYLNPLLTIRHGGRVLPSRGGLAAWVLALANGAVEADAVVETLRHTDDVSVDLALCLSVGRDTRVTSFVNQSPLTEGTHLDGLWKGLRDGARQLGIKANVGSTREALSPGLVAALNVSLSDPEFAGSARYRLKSPIATGAVQRAVREALSRSFRFNETFKRAFAGRFPA